MVFFQHRDVLMILWNVLVYQSLLKKPPYLYGANPPTIGHNFCFWPTRFWVWIFHSIFLNFLLIPPIELYLYLIPPAEFANRFHSNNYIYQHLPHICTQNCRFFRSHTFASRKKKNLRFTLYTDIACLFWHIHPTFIFHYRSAQIVKKKEEKKVLYLKTVYQTKVMFTL